MRVGVLAAVLSFAAAAPARAAIQHDHDADGLGTGATLTLQTTVADGADRYLLVGVVTAEPATPARAVTFAGAPLGLLAAAATPHEGCRVEWWGLVAPAEGTHPIVIDVGVAIGKVGAGAASYFGVHPLGAVPARAHASGMPAPAQVAIDSAPEQVILDGTCGWSPDSVLANAGPDQETRWHWSTGSLSAAASSKPGAPGSTLTWTESGPHTMEWASIAVALRPSTDRLDLGQRVEGGCGLAHRPNGRNGPGASLLWGALFLGLTLLRAGTFGRRSRGTTSVLRTGTSRALPAREEMPDLDEITLARAKAGDPKAQTAIVHRYERPVFSLLWRMVGPQRELVEDLTQETFLRVLRSLHRFDQHGRARLVTWILTIAARLAVDHLRASKPRTDVGLGGIPGALPTPDQEAQRHALGGALVRAVEGLGPQFRAAFLLREVHGMSYEEISDALSIDVGTVKSRLARARAALQACLAEMHDG